MVINQIIIAIKGHKNLFHFGLSMAPMSNEQKEFKSSEHMVALFNVVLRNLVKPEAGVVVDQQLAGNSDSDGEP
jgi:hypothetical protein